MSLRKSTFKRLPIAFGTLLLVGSFGESLAFDGARKGLILGGGVGAGFLSHELIFQSRVETENTGVFLTEFKIGGVPSNSLEVYFISKVPIWQMTNSC